MGNFVIIDNTNAQLIHNFLDLAGSSLNSFRYYDKRSISVIENHLYTCLYFDQNIPVSYGHLDQEDGITWLGIAVIEGQTGKGYGKIMLHHLIEVAKEQGVIEIQLSVDNDNIKAIELYRKYGFRRIKTGNTTSFFNFTI